MSAAPRLVLCSIDGGIPGIVRDLDLFNIASREPSAVRDLISIYPSSTAPAHASFLTGARPDRHGIIGNRFWESKSVAEIHRLRTDPLAAIHPYESTSLLAPSILDAIIDRGWSTAALAFPQTFTLSGHARSPGMYCLYAPARTLQLRQRPNGTLEAETEYFGESLSFLVTPLPNGRSTISVSDTSVAMGTQRVRLDFSSRAGLISVGASYHSNDRQLWLGTATVQLVSGGMPQDLVPRGDGPSSLQVDYKMGDGIEFFESPRAEWVEDQARRIVAHFQPDILFLRFNQADHAQEYLYWYATRGSKRERIEAEDLIRETYLKIDRCVRRLTESFSSDTQYLFFSDHGIDYVEEHLRPNAVIADLGWQERMVFEGDSNCAYLYSDEALDSRDREHLIAMLSSVLPGVSVIDNRRALSLGLPTDGRRAGCLIISTGEHTEFRYNNGTPSNFVTSASHGYFPSQKSMRGFAKFVGFGDELDNDPSTLRITNLAPIILRQLSVL
uniref:Type I phosphodiesterase/nucleotide pyrophosphatase n=1 Tax=Rathayibacter sp. FH 236 TaxID=2615183 RepID=A0A5J6SGY1_9MICO|nr:type I phosphodiesterase/nucleotide pyrophosphatase [Rathayibacter sp. FH 236]